MILTLSNSDYIFFCEYADDPFRGFKVGKSGKMITLDYTPGDRDAWYPFEEAYDEAYLEHAPKPEYEPDNIGLRLERISDDLVDQSYKN